MNIFILYYASLVASALGLVVLLVLLVRDLLGQRKRKRVGFLCSPFLDHWAHGDKPRRQNIRRV